MHFFRCTLALVAIVAATYLRVFEERTFEILHSIIQGEKKRDFVECRRRLKSVLEKLISNSEWGHGGSLVLYCKKTERNSRMLKLSIEWAFLFFYLSPRRFDMLFFILFEPFFQPVLPLFADRSKTFQYRSLIHWYRVQARIYGATNVSQVQWSCSAAKNAGEKKKLEETYTRVELRVHASLLRNLEKDRPVISESFGSHIGRPPKSERQSRRTRRRTLIITHVSGGGEGGALRRSSFFFFYRSASVGDE